ncbi:MAG: hypothetical protein JWN98_1039, partial [Abditibacteriota bacterium]|nr:hypothetical protein [Abditibacteriota bacterium]
CISLWRLFRDCPVTPVREEHSLRYKEQAVALGIVEGEFPYPVLRWKHIALAILVDERVYIIDDEAQ